MFLQGYSVIPECQSSATPLSLVQRCNYHSSRILDALQEGSTDSTLCPPATPTNATQPEIQLLASHSSQCSTDSPASLCAVAQALSTWQPQQVHWIIGTPELTNLILQTVQADSAHSAIAYLAPGGMLMPSGCGQKASTILTMEQQQQVFRHQAAIAELLRHFWSCFPVRTAQLEAKVFP